MPSRHYPDESDGLTLKEVARQACKLVDIGCAVLPKPLFQFDVDEVEQDEQGLEEHDEEHDRSLQPTHSKAGGNISTEYREELPRSYSFSKTTRYSKVLQHEFNAIVIEHHLKWTPLCVS